MMVILIIEDKTGKLCLGSSVVQAIRFDRMGNNIFPVSLIP